MVSLEKGKRNMQRDVIGGTLLIAGSLANMLVMSLHPTGQQILHAPNFAQAHLGVMVHSLALAATPIIFLGLLHLSRRLGPSDLTTAALVSYGFGGVAIMSAAVASGFVATGVFEQILTAEAGSRDVYHALAGYTGLVNQGFAKVNVAASSVAILLWSTAVLTSRRFSRAAGVAGLVVGAGILVAFLSGHLILDVHGFGIVTYAQSGWMIWVGILLLLRGRSAPPV